MKKEVNYELEGFLVATDWYGNKGFVHLLIKTNPQGLEKIKKDPLQDYIEFGVQSIDYVQLDVYRIERFERNGFLITKETTKPVETIESGNYDLSEDEESILMDVLAEPPEVIRYK
jgi:hypothetical protein